MDNFWSFRPALTGCRASRDLYFKNILKRRFLLRKSVGKFCLGSGELWVSLRTPCSSIGQSSGPKATVASPKMRFTFWVDFFCQFLVCIVFAIFLSFAGSLQSKFSGNFIIKNFLASREFISVQLKKFFEDEGQKCVLIKNSRDCIFCYISIERYHNVV